MKSGTASITVGQFGEFGGAVMRQLARAVEGLDAETLQEYIEDQDSLGDLLHHAFHKNGGAETPTEEPDVPAPTVTSFPLTVSYDLGVKDLVARGKYDYANPDITAKNFPATGTGTADSEAHLVHFDRAVSTEEAEKELDTLGFRPGNLHELLAFGARYPEEQRKFPIVELASRWQSPDGRVGCAYLDRHADYRELDLGFVEDDWCDYSRFLAFRK